MSRAEKRRTGRYEAWFNSLSDDKKQILNNIINEKLNHNNDIMSSITDTCMVSALDDILDMDMSKIVEIMKKTKSYIVEYGEYLEREKNGGIKMIENVELRERAKTKIKMYMLGKMDKARGLKLLKNEFNLPFAELSDLWIECKSGEFGKEGYSNSKTMPDTKVEYVEPDKENVVNSINNVVKNKAKMVIPNIPIDDNKVIVKNGNNLRIVSVTTQVEGLYGAYTKGIEGVRVDDKLYSSKDVVKDEKVRVVDIYKTQMDSIREKIDELNIELKNVEILEMKDIERFAELESVFDL